MVYRIPTSLTGTGPLVTAAAGDIVYVASTVDLLATSGTAIYTVGYAQIFVQGEVFGSVGVDFGPSSSRPSRVDVSASGSITGDIAAVRSHNSDTDIYNNGIMSSIGGNAYNFSGYGNSIIHNYGTISGGSYPTDANGNTAAIYGEGDLALGAILTIYNHGKITGGLGGAAVSAEATRLFIFNLGTIEGNINANPNTNSGMYFDSSFGQANVYVQGGSGRDTIIGGYTGGSLFGGGGDDLIYANQTQLAADNHAKTGLTGSAGNNALYGGGAYNTFDAGTGIGLFGISGVNQVWGGRSLMSDVNGYLNNTLSYLNSSRGVYVDLLNGHNAFARDGANWVFHDWIQNVPNVTGSGYSDVIQADGTGGTIYGLGGADALYGATGKDIFKYAAYEDSNLTTGYDTIVNFERGTDKIDISGFLAGWGLTGASLALAGVGNSTTVYVQRTPGTKSDTTDLAFVVNSTGGVLTATDFIL